MNLGGQLFLKNITKKVKLSRNAILASPIGDKYIQRFLSRVNKTASCWIWMASKSVGYGQFCVRGKNMSAHRVSYRIFKGPIPLGLTIDHLCRNRACVNPAHLEAVTHYENIRRGLNIEKPNHCRRGHKFTKKNTIYKRTNTWRHCRKCKQLHERNFYYRKKERSKTI